MDKKTHEELKVLLIDVFDEAVAILALERRMDNPGMKPEELSNLLKGEFSAAALADDEKAKEEMLSFIAAENNMGIEEDIAPSKERKRDTIRLLKQIRQDLTGEDSVKNAELALRLITVGYERHKNAPKVLLN